MWDFVFCLELKDGRRQLKKTSQRRPLVDWLKGLQTFCKLLQNVGEVVVKIEAPMHNVIFNSFPFEL